MCTDLESALAELLAHGVTASPISTQSWGRVTAIQLPSDEEFGLYEPRHPLALPVK